MSESTPRVLGGRYEVGALLGRGGMAEVHRGYDTRLGRPVAVKLLRADLARDHNFLTRFRREAQSAAGLNHHAIVAVYDSGEDSTTDAGGAPVALPYIVMELVEGETLRDKLNAQGKLEPGEAARVTAQVLEALGYSHKMGIIHRDIKPANVMITKSGEVKVMDFGIARAVADTQATMTQTQAVIGTAQYLSPEQAQGQTVDNRSDLYSTGCMLFELLTGRPPYTGDSPVSIAYQHVGEPVPAPSQFNPLVSPAMDTVVKRSLVKDKAARYQSAAEFREDLVAAREGRALSDRAPAAATEAMPAVAPAAGVGATQVVPAVPAATTSQVRTVVDDPEPEKKRDPWKIALVALLIMALLGGATYLVLRQMNANKPSAVTNVTVPSVRGLPQAQAEAELAKVQLKSTAKTVNDSAEKGTVVKQSPESGASVAQGSSVELSVSGGPEMIVVPAGLEGKTEAEAKALLTTAGFQVGTSISENKPGVDKGKVISSAPAGGTSQPKGTQIVLTISSGHTLVPSYIGKSVESAKVGLEGLGLVIHVEDVTTTDKPAGTVLDQNVKDVAVPNGSTITIKVARAPVATPTVTVTLTPTPTTPAPNPTAPNPTASKP